MKSFKNYIVALGVASIMLPACNADFGDINKDPNKMEVVSPASMITPVIYYGNNILVNRHHRLISQLMQYQLQTNGFEAISQYTIKDSDPNYLWTNLYRRYGDANEICRISELYKNDNMKAVGLILRTWLMSNIADIWGDVPHTDALGALNGNLRPKFDRQQDIYVSLLGDLKEANILLTGNSEMGLEEKSFDILFNGNKTSWRKLANSLRLRLLLRVSGKSEIDVKAEMTAMTKDIVAYPIFTSVSEGAYLRYSGVKPFVSTFSDVKDNEFSGNYRMCSRLIDLMNETGDKRREKFMTNISGAYYGIASGNDQAYIVGAMDNNGLGTSKLNANLQSPTCPFAIMPYSELQFILSEAAFKGLISTGTSAEEYYKRGVKASLDEWSVVLTNSGKDLFISQDLVRFNGTLDRIIEQKWIALYFVGFESWYDYRRTGCPDMPKGNALSNDGVLPTRLRYPAILQSVNSENLQKAIDQMGGANDMKTKVWWAK